MAITKYITKIQANGVDTYEIKYTYPQDENGGVFVEFRGPFTLTQLQHEVAVCEEKLADWSDNLAKCLQVE